MDGRQHAVDGGSIVHNDVTYPWLRRLFRELYVEVRPAEMSMSVRCEGCGLQYAGGRGLHGVFAQPRHLIDPRFVGTLWQVKRFHRRASAFLRMTDDENLTTYGEFLEREGFSGYFIAHYAVPVVSCVWSAGRETTLACPARYLFRFLDHHGERHAYLLHPDEAGTAVTGKHSYISPFFDVSGTYELRFTLRPDLVATTVTLRRHDAVACSATFRARPEPVTAPALARRLIRQPLMPSGSRP